VPNQWSIDVLVITKPLGAEVRVDGVVVPADHYAYLGGSSTGKINPSPQG
jgi:hypothetical protein